MVLSALRIQLKTPLETMRNDLNEVIRLFYGDVEIVPEGDAALTIVHTIANGEHLCAIGEHEVRYPAAVETGDVLVDKRLLKRGAKMCLYLALKEVTGQEQPWGALTGIRPTRLYKELLEQGVSQADAVIRLGEVFDVSREKAELLREICAEQEKVPPRASNEIDVYAGIPFCTTRCSYCSFSSMDLKHGEKLTEPYTQAIQREMELCAESLKGYKIRSIYIGGGTPTSLSAEQLGRICETLRKHYPCDGEFTIEAGRPDTITREKLEVMMKYGVKRISVNPQTMSDETLARIGRRHTAQDVVDAYDLIRRYPFEAVNMDLILALPGETRQDIQETMRRVIDLAPDDLTIHTLAIKRASALRLQGFQADTAQAMRMVDYAREQAVNAGYTAYYLYRQKYMAGNLENVGYCKPGKACVYNIDIMEETTPIAAFGAGSITKWLYEKEKRIERAANVKSVEEYIARVDEMAQKKQALWLPCTAQQEEVY